MGRGGHRGKKGYRKGGGGGGAKGNWGVQADVMRGKQGVLVCDDSARHEGRMIRTIY